MARFKQFLPVMGFAWLIFYFAYHILTGEQRLQNLVTWRVQESTLKAQLVQLQTCRAKLERHIQLLADDNLDLDYLEERTHAVLYYVDPRDKVLSLDLMEGNRAQRVDPCTTGQRS